MKPLQLCFWVMVQNGFEQSHCRIGKMLIYQEVIKLWSWFCMCGYSFAESTNWINNFFFVSSETHWFSDDNYYVFDDDNDDHYYSNSHNNSNGVHDKNHESYIRIMVIMITMVGTAMIIETAMIKMINLITIVIMMMIRPWMSK